MSSSKYSYTRSAEVRCYALADAMDAAVKSASMYSVECYVMFMEGRAASVSEDTSI